MTRTTTLPTLTEAKRLATALRADRAAEGKPVTHSQALEAIAHRLGHRDWNGLHAAIARQTGLCPVTVGERVAGRYLGQPFEGSVLTAAPTQRDGIYRVVLRFDAPVDVVRFESFSAYRQRVTCHLDRDGRTAERTSDGAPHLELAHPGG